MRAGAAVAVLVLACSGDGGPRWTSERDHFSVRELEGWNQKEEFGATVFVKDRVTISVKTAEIKDPAAVVPATGKFLRSLPGAQVSEGRTHRVGGFSAATFDLSFHPEERADRYERRHTVLV